MRELSLFSGGGGGLLASKLLGWRTVGYVEFNEYCQRILRARQDDGLLDRAPIFGDIRAFISEGYADAYQGMVDVVSGGFPCQPFSTAARGRNKLNKDRWSDFLNVVRVVRPKYVFAENVSRFAIVKAGIDLTTIGYRFRFMPLPASALGAPHRRKRWWLAAYADSNSEPFGPVNAKTPRVQIASGLDWESEPSCHLGMDDGVASRVDRLRALGNGQVPAVAAAAWLLLTEGWV